MFLLLLMFAFHNTPFPSRDAVLTKDFIASKNFFPLATLDLKSKGINEPIHIIYIFFDYRMTEAHFEIKGDNVRNFSFQVTPDGKYQPLFKQSALEVQKDQLEYLEDTRQTYEKAKTKEDVLKLIEYPDAPEWHDDDQTPIASNGKKMKFICQLELFDVVHDEGRLYVFYDPDKKIVKHIYQRF